MINYIVMNLAGGVELTTQRFNIVSIYTWHNQEGYLDKSGLAFTMAVL